MSGGSESAGISGSIFIIRKPLSTLFVAPDEQCSSGAFLFGKNDVILKNKMIEENMRKSKGKVIVAMSGGVDSSVAAALLKKQGYDVVGVFMRFWAEPNARFAATNTCCSAGAEQAARDVASKLDIPFYILRLGKEFKKEVVDHFLRESDAGRTPNPCVVCNKKIKFGLLFKKALGMGADYIATGHYAKIQSSVIASPDVSRGEAIPRQTAVGDIILGLPCRPARCGAPRNDTYTIFKAKDKDKDQSYFLYALTQRQLSRVLFPLADYTKEEVYKLAKKWRLSFRRGESFDLCFVARDIESFLKKYIKMKLGKIVDYNSCHAGLDPVSSLDSRFRGNDKLKDGKILGEHQGLAFYTIGQRKNIPLNQGPWWVVKKDTRKNILYVSNDEKDLYSKELAAGNINWTSRQAPRLRPSFAKATAGRQGYGGQAKLPQEVLIKIRYKSEASPAVIYRIATPRFHVGARNDTVRVIFGKPQRAVTPGQSAVFYSKKGELLGGGVIQ
ncbi:MAG: tRNA 2-thiouridine(34) synthase MnmA [bacterium]